MSKEEISSDGLKERIINFESDTDEEPNKPQLQQYDINYYDSESEVKDIKDDEYQDDFEVVKGIETAFKKASEKVHNDSDKPKRQIPRQTFGYYQSNQFIIYFNVKIKA